MLKGLRCVVNVFVTRHSSHAVNYGGQAAGLLEPEVTHVITLTPALMPS